MRTLILVAAVFGASGVTLAQGDDLLSVLGRARAYVAEFERTVPPALVDEAYQQNGDLIKNLGGSNFGAGGAAGTGGGGASMLEKDTIRVKRQAVSELLLVRTDLSPGGWAALRDTVEVDGKATHARDDRLQKAFDPAPGALAKQLRQSEAEASKLNIGPPVRLLNVALGALALLRAADSTLRFEKAGEERIGGTPAWKIGFSGQGPAAVVGRPGNTAPLRGTVWVDPKDGRVLRTRVESGERLDAYQFRVEVSYALDAALGVLVPVEMKERFEGPEGRVEGKATYSNYRRIAKGTD